ncbi:uncharacterized protein LOC130825165 [Amaranthus tricolor]|uniref:uncharacterized protein LOC130825165 n=1 Tax=Amaranthus tricolor TaxID=29722 RepID=UPI0025832A38|nr:uncharacterized protein LOC130825165 [Amaranthus tricolor]XP_057546227.1 uncharacterized protein LOC130825165 [Amaranthus tricolor]XP_057546229.1 uncharacterized protein LOC130825165 [Amaranthus tricolor]
MMFIHRQNTNFEVFHSKIIDVIGCDCNSFMLKLEMKYPVTGKNVLVPIKNDESISALAYAASQAPGTAMEVYVELVANLGNAREVMTSMELPKLSPSVRHDTFTEMLSNLNYVNEHLDEFTSPTHSRGIGGGVMNTFSTSHLGRRNANEVDSLDQEDEHIDSDSEEDDDRKEALDAAIRDGAPSQDWLRIDEVDQRWIDAWMTWNDDNFLNENGDFRIGQEFSSLDHLKKNLKAWAIYNNRNFCVIESKPSKYVIQCTNAEVIGCEWRMRVVMTFTGLFKIVRYQGHNQDCSAHYSDDHPLLSSEFVVDFIVDMVRVDPAFKVKSIVNFVKNKYGFAITYKRAWLAKNKAITKVFGDWDKSFEELLRSLQALMQYDPGTMVQWEVQPIMDPTRVMFQRIFRSFGPSIKGFLHCRPLISIDDTHLYGKYRDTLMIAMAIDGNSQLSLIIFL